MGFKKKLKKKLKGIINSYEDDSKLGEYAKGRLANTKMILDIVKKMDYIPCCTELCDRKFSDDFVDYVQKNAKERKVESLWWCDDRMFLHINHLHRYWKEKTKDF